MYIIYICISMYIYIYTSQNCGYLFGPENRYYNILRSILGSPVSANQLLGLTCSEFQVVGIALGFGRSKLCVKNLETLNPKPFQSL